MVGPVKRETQIITSGYGFRWRLGKRKFHKGIDLRTVKFPEETDEGADYSLQPCVAVERCRVKRFGTDPNDNDFIVLEPLSGEVFEYKYIHVTLEFSVTQVGIVLNEGTIIGYSQLKGQSDAHHLHFEVWLSPKKCINPFPFLKEKGIKIRKK